MILVQDTATKRKTALAAVYQQMRDMLAQEEREAQYEVDHELENSQTKLQDLMKRLIENTEKMAKARADVNSLLSQSQTLAFLQVGWKLSQENEIGEELRVGYWDLAKRQMRLNRLNREREIPIKMRKVVSIL